MPIIVEEKSLQLALVKAARQLETTQDELVYKVVSENSGLFGVFGKKVAVEVWKRNRSGRKGNNRGRDLGSSNSVTPDQRKLLSKDDILRLSEELRLFCEGICQRITQKPLKVTAQLDGERLLLNVKCQFLSNQLSENPRLAEAMEHILRRKPKDLKQEMPFRIFFDVNSQRCEREIELVDMAQDLSDKVFENKRPIVLNYRNSYDRKVIHMALDKDNRVYTKSIGSGPNRKLMILPARDSTHQPI